MSNIDALSRQELQTLCKQHGIKGNISTKDMKMCLKKAINNQPFPYKFKKLTWFQKNKDYIFTGITFTALASSLICVFYIFKK